ncbi:hypothetical protein C8J56DRAFT_1167246 [Mycena floridula]|nr:hypothetical protein C8J56DRAFT_1167246 [Mycena floridula]
MTTMLPEELLVMVIEYLAMVVPPILPQQRNSAYHLKQFQYTPPSRELAAFSLANKQIRRICFPFLFGCVKLRGTEKLKKLDRQCLDIPTVVKSIRTLHLTRIDGHPDACETI